jgi:predicted enzyme related to lactoylglutathione lyase
VEDRKFGGIQDMAKTGQPKQVPPHWLTYFKTQDAEASVRRAAELGADVVAGVMRLAGTRRIAVLRDPQGAVFGLYQE